LGHPMKAALRYVPTILLAALALSSVALAGPLEDGNAAYKRHDYKTAMRILRPLAIEGDKLAQVIVGLMYELGYGVQLDWIVAFEWFNAAAKDGDNFGAFNLNEVSHRMTAREIAKAIDISHQWTPGADPSDTHVEPETWNCSVTMGKKVVNIVWELANGRMFAARGTGFHKITAYTDQFIVATQVSRPQKPSDGPITDYIVIEKETGNYLDLDNIGMAVLGRAYDDVAEPSTTTGHCEPKGGTSNR
jgi:hypothetical protein